MKNKVGRPKKDQKKYRLTLSIDPVIFKQAKKFFGRGKLSKKVEQFFKESLVQN